ncbi:MAG: nucleotidyltransferase family protein [Candidatus Zixiibacteriota bacterium]
MVAVILAGGQGIRLRPHTDEFPKPLLPIGQKPIIDILLTQMKKTGVSRVILAVNHMSERIVDAVGDGSRYGLKIEYSHETKALSTVAPLKLIKDLPDNFIVANSDILTDLDFKGLFSSHINGNAQLTVATHARANPIDFGVLTVDDNGMVIGFEEKPVLNIIVSMGMYVFSQAVLKLVPENKPFGFDQLMFTMLDRKMPIHTFPYSGYWLDIGRPEDYQKANEDIERLWE